MDIPIEHTELPQSIAVDAERQQKAREYARIRRRLSFINIGISVVGVLLIFLTGFDVWLRNALLPLNWQPVPSIWATRSVPYNFHIPFNWSPLIVACYLLILTVGYTLITAPLSYYSGFVMPHSQSSEASTQFALVAYSAQMDRQLP